MRIGKVIVATVISVVVSTLLLSMSDFLPAIGVEFQAIILTIATFAGSAAYVIAKHRL